MTFYEEVRAFFKKYDPSRIRLSGKIAATYKTRSSQKAAMKRLHEVYAGGGPSAFDFAAGKTPKAASTKKESVVAVNEDSVIEDFKGLDDHAEVAD